MNWLNATGKIEIDNGLRIITDVDFCKYYLTLFHWSIWKTKKYQLPAHKAHITVYNPKIHGQILLDEFTDLVGQTIEFSYDCNLYISPVNVWAPVKCPWADEFRNKLGIPITYFEETSLHLTIGNIKYN